MKKDMWILILIGVMVALFILYSRYAYFQDSTQSVYKGMCGDHVFEISLVTKTKNALEVGPQTDLQISYAPDTGTSFTDKFGYQPPEGIETLMTLSMPETTPDTGYWDIVLAGSGAERNKAQDLAACIEKQSNEINSAVSAIGNVDARFNSDRVLIRSVGYIETLYSSKEFNSFPTAILPEYKFECDSNTYLRISPENIVYSVDSLGWDMVGYIHVPTKTFHYPAYMRPDLKDAYQTSMQTCKNPNGKTVLDLFNPVTDK